MGFATAAAIFSAVQGVSSIAQGMQQKSVYKQEARNATASAEMAAQEQVRQSFKEAEIEKDQVKDFERRQKLAYLTSGVKLDGSPLLVMQETRKKGAENVDEILTSGDYAYNTTITEGRNRAGTLKAQGRQAFMTGISNAAGSFAKTDWSKLK